MKLTREVYAVGGGRSGLGISDANDCNVYLVDGGDELALIDAGCGVDIGPLLANIEAEGFDPATVHHLLLTHAHADHAGGSAALRQRLGLDVAVSCHSADALTQADETAISLDRARAEGVYPADFHMQPCPIARRLTHNDEVHIGSVTLRAIELPGHSTDSICYLLAEGERVCLFTGDTVFVGGGISLLNCDGSSLTSYRRHIGRLAGLGVEALLPGHSSLCLGGGQEHIDTAIEAFKSIWPPPNFR